MLFPSSLRILLTGFFLAFLPATLLAWGPHSEITQAAVDILGPDSAIVRQLGPETARLHDYCWMADWRRQLRREDRQWFYTDDYLLFPRMTTHRDHICPDVELTYEPYFRRALQALRTETPANAVRWIGSLMHFTEDSGSPPHAAQIRGDVHSKMENWVDAKAIHIEGYRPQSFGATDDEAVAGFLKRMNGLIAFSKERAERAKPFVLAGDRAATEPIVLESALECSRVIADLLFTLGQLAEKTPADAGASLRGTIASIASPGLEKLSAKIVLVGTDFSTLIDADGRYEFHHLPAGAYRVVMLQPGYTSSATEVTLAPDQTATQDFPLPANAGRGNVIRNSALANVWLSPTQPDDWYPVKSRIDGPFWEGEMLPLEKGRTYRLQVVWQEQQPATGAAPRVVVRLRKNADFSQLPDDLRPLMPGETTLDFQATGGYAQVLVYTAGPASAVARNVMLTAVP